jgi:hypothetical protein
MAYKLKVASCAGNNSGFFNVPVVHCSGIQHTFYGKHRLVLMTVKGLCHGSKQYC